MTDYHFQGIIVDMKADNSHGSARVAHALDNPNLDGANLQISAGAVVIQHASDVSKLDVATTGSENVLGIATQTRAIGDVRPLTYTRKGLVHAIKDATALASGAPVQCGVGGTVIASTEFAHTIGRCIEGSAGTAGGEVVVVELTLV